MPQKSRKYQNISRKVEIVSHASGINTIYAVLPTRKARYKAG
jgi:hypothetical protein